MDAAQSSISIDVVQHSTPCTFNDRSVGRAVGNCFVHAPRDGKISTFPEKHLAQVFSPTKRIICVSYGQDLADKLARDTRTIMMSALYLRVFPCTRLSKNSISDFETTRQGLRRATSVGGALIGLGG